MIQLRDYQKKAVDEIFDSLTRTKPGLCPCVVAPTGSGKSVLIARVISDSLYYWGKDFKILLLTHQKELIEQDVRKLEGIEPELDIGIYSASLKRKELFHTVTFASIQSLISKKEELENYFDLIIIDECHLINNKSEGQYQEFLSTQSAVVIGFTATPFRMSQGRLVEDGNLFDYYIETIGILDMQKQGYLSRLTTKDTLNKIDVTDVKIVAGEFSQKDLDEKVNNYKTNQAIAEEIVKKLEYYHRYHCVVFCSSVAQAKNIDSLINDMDIPSVCVEGSMNKQEREKTLQAFTSGEARVICNCSILTTGFDYPAIDCVALIRPTLSTGLYLQMVGRGIRISPETGKENCLLLDFGGNVERHGPIGKPMLNIKKEGKGKGQGLSPVKVCPMCLEVVERKDYICPSCGYEFPIKSGLELTNPRHLYYGDPNGDESENEEKSYLVNSWNWFKGTGVKDPHYERWEVTYFCHGTTVQVKEYLIIDERVNPFIRKKANDRFSYFCSKFGIKFSDYIYRVGGIAYPVLAETIREAGPPVIIYTRKNDNGYMEVTGMVTKEEYHKCTENYRIYEENILEKQKEIMNENSKN